MKCKTSGDSFRLIKNNWLELQHRIQERLNRKRPKRAIAFRTKKSRLDKMKSRLLLAEAISEWDKMFGDEDGPKFPVFCGGLNAYSPGDEVFQTGERCGHQTHGESARYPTIKHWKRNCYEPVLEHVEKTLAYFDEKIGKTPGRDPDPNVQKRRKYVDNLIENGKSVNEICELVNRPMHPWKKAGKPIPVTTIRKDISLNRKPVGDD